jgi:hypothetical protein
MEVGLNPMVPIPLQSTLVRESKLQSNQLKEIMSLISLIVTLVVVGVLLWLVNTYLPMDGKIKQILNIVVVICVVVWLLFAFGIIDRSSDIRVPKLD